MSSPGTAPEIQQHCPEHYRFLIQAVGCQTVMDAAKYVFEAFGRPDAIFVKGVYRPANKHAIGGPWTFREEDGWMAFVPLGGRHA